MRHAAATTLLIWTMLALAAWGGAAPRIWCSGPNGHVALESAYSSCCEEVGSPCTRPAPPDLAACSAGPADDCRDKVVRRAAENDRCTDSLLRLLPAPGIATQPAVIRTTPSGDLSIAQVPDPTDSSRTIDPRGERGSPPTPLDLRTTLLI